MKVVWTPEALQDRLDIWDYIAADNRRAAIKIDTLFSNAAAKLAVHPDLGRPGLVSGTRELIPMSTNVSSMKSMTTHSEFWPWFIPKGSDQDRLPDGISARSWTRMI